MGAFPSAAAQVKPFDPFEYRSKALQIQQQQQSVQSNDIDLQAKKRAAEDDKTIQQAVTQNPGKTLHDLLPTLSGHVTAARWVQLNELDSKMQESFQKKTEADLKIAEEQHKQYSGIYGAVMNMPDEQVAANWPQIAQSILAVPGNKLQVDPAKPMTKQEIQSQSPMLALNESYLQGEIAKRKAKADATVAEGNAAEAPAKLASAQADAKLKQQQAEAGGTSDVDKYIANYLKEKNLPNTAANWARGHKAYTDETKTDPGIARAIAFAANRPVQIIDPNNPNQVKYDSAGNAIKTGAATPASASFQTNKAELKSELPTKIGDQKVAFNTAMQHADLLENAAKALNNGDQNTLNSLKNRLEKEFGATGPVNAQVIANAYTREITAMLAKGHITDAEVNSAGGTTDVNKMSLPQTMGVLKAYRSLAQSKLNMLNKQVQDTQDKAQGKTPAQQPAANDPFSNFGGKTR